MPDRERFAPITLATEEPIAEAIVDRDLAEPLGIQLGGNPGLELSRCQPRIRPRVDCGSQTGKRHLRLSVDFASQVSLFFRVFVFLRRLYHGDDRYPELDGELPVAHIVGWDRHDCA